MIGDAKQGDGIFVASHTEDSRYRESWGRYIKTKARRLLPVSVVSEITRYRGYENLERGVYLRTRILDGLADPKHRRVPSTARSFVFVCFGNIMRSPLCEVLMKRATNAIPGISVSSAGLNATPGRAAEPRAIAAARRFGVSLEDHRARALTDGLLDQTDVVLVMDYQNRTQILSRYGGVGKKVLMLSAYGGEAYESVEIADPYYMDENGAQKCFEVLNACVQNLALSFRREILGQTTMLLDPGNTKPGERGSAAL